MLSHKEGELLMHKNVKRLRICLWAQEKGKLQFGAYCICFYIIEFAQYEKKFTELRQKLINLCRALLLQHSIHCFIIVWNKSA